MKSTCQKYVVFPLRMAFAVAVILGACFVGDVIAQTSPPADAGLQAFEVVRSVFQHARCQNCHIPGDAPLQGNAGNPHDVNVMRGPDGHGAVAMECAVCHMDKNLPASYGDHVPPGAPNWHLPSPQTKMVFIGLSPHDLCEAIKNRTNTGGRDLKAMLAHVRDDKLVAWGWAPGGQRTLPPATRAETVAAFQTWIDSGALCPM